MTAYFAAMITADPTLATSISAPSTRGLNRDFISSKSGDLLPLADGGLVLLSGHLSLALYAAVFVGKHWSAAVSADLQRLIWLAAIGAAFILYEQRFSALRSAGRRAAVLRGFVARWLVLSGVVALLAFAARWLEVAPSRWLVCWLLCAVLLTAGSRLLLWALSGKLLARSGKDCATNNVSPALPMAHVGESLPVRLLADRPIRRWNAVLKASKDRMLGLLILLMLTPVLAAIAVAIKLDSRGPVLFKQRRHGINNREFNIYKFRSMHCAPASSGDALQQTVRGDPRVTRVGAFLRKWSLDELPQIFNVLEGSMSLVGPRPHAVNMRTEQRLGHEIMDSYCHRHRVKPGITGWSQINGSRGATDTVEQLRRRIELDLHYVDNWSLLFDLKILSLTFKEVLRATNAY